MKSVTGLAFGALLIAGCATKAGPSPAGTVSGTAAAQTAAAPTAEVRTVAPSTADAAIPTREPLDQHFGPDYPVQPPTGDLVHIESAWLSADLRTLTVTFVGSMGYLASDPCSEDYEPWVAAHGDELDVAIVNVHRPHGSPAAQGAFCSLIAHSSWYHLALGAPFTGTAVHDRSGGVLDVGMPSGLDVATALPIGWSLQRWLELEPGRKPTTWIEIYAEAYGETADGVETLGGTGQLLLYQASGTGAKWSDIGAAAFQAPGATQVPITINGAPATVWKAVSGGLFVAWTLDGQSLAMVGNAEDMTPADLARFAASVAANTP